MASTDSSKGNQPPGRLQVDLEEESVWRTFPLWLACWAVGWSACYVLGMIGLQWYNDQQIFWLTQIPYWQGFLLFGFGKLGGDAVWHLVRRWQGRR